MGAPRFLRGRLPRGFSAGRFLAQRAGLGLSSAEFAAHHWETGYRLFVESIRKNCRHGGVLRIDHVMRFFRLYWIPDGVDATEGAYVRDRWEDLIRIVALESVRHQVVVVGEDLGTVEPFVREALARFGILSYRLFYFERDQSGRFLPFENTRCRRWFHPPPTTCRRWRDSGKTRTSRRAGVPVCWAAKELSRAVSGRAEKSRRCSTCSSRPRLLPDSLPRSASEDPGIDGRVAQRRDRIPGLTPRSCWW